MNSAASICQHGLVVALSGGQAVVELSAARCAGCPGAAGCRSRGVLQGWFAGRSPFVHVAAAKLHLGQTVRLSISSAGLATAALISYGLPLLGLLGGLLLGAVVGREWLSIVAGAAGFGAGVMLGRDYRPLVEVEVLQP